MPSLLIVGGLTIDRFADGSRAPGGSVLHSGLAAIAQGADLAVLTVAGDEPEARVGIERLESLGTVLCQPSAATTTYRHEEADGRRVLVYEARSEHIDPAGVERLPGVDVVLVSPIADELPVEAIARLREALPATQTVLLIQGWLRQLGIGHAVRPRRLEEVPESTWRAFRDADAVVLSNEDFASDTDDAFAQSAAVRERIGAGPLLVLTLAAKGYLLDDPRADRVVASVPRNVVDGVPMVGAGDTFGAGLAIALARGASPSDAAEAATDCVIAVLESRRT
jgi:sugar/nucleoside kinase (ribokinase family)